MGSLQTTGTGSTSPPERSLRTRSSPETFGSLITSQDPLERIAHLRILGMQDFYDNLGIFDRSKGKELLFHDYKECKVYEFGLENKLSALKKKKKKKSPHKKKKKKKKKK